MPHFLDLFINELREKREDLRQTFAGEKATEVDGQLRDAFQGEWRPLPSSQKTDLKIIAVDSGRSTREYTPGTFMYICRATALTSGNKQYRKITSNAHIISSPREQLRDMVSLRSEHVEHEVTLKAIKDTSDVDIVLIDGSLYGRSLHVPISYNYPGERTLYLQYIETFNHLLEECRKRKILLLGVSKDSVASHLTQMLMVKIQYSILNSLELGLSETELTLLHQHFENLGKESYALIKLVKELPLTEDRRKLLFNLIYELRRPRPDFALIHAWAETAGYTTPIEPYPDIPFFKYESKDPIAYLQRRFNNAYIEYPEESMFEDWAIPIMKSAFELPTFVTFCAKLMHNDTPLRIDLPAFNVGLSTRVSEISQTRLLDPPPRQIEEVLQILQTEYGGPDLYNVYLVRADQEARLPVSDVATLYEPLVEKELKIPLISTRRNRRIRYG